MDSPYTSPADPKIKVRVSDIHAATAIMWDEILNARGGIGGDANTPLLMDWPIQLPAWVIRDLLIYLVAQGFQVRQGHLVGAVGPLKGRDGKNV